MYLFRQFRLLAVLQTSHLAYLRYTHGHILLFRHSNQNDSTSVCSRRKKHSHNSLQSSFHHHQQYSYYYRYHKLRLHDNLLFQWYNMQNSRCRNYCRKRRIHTAYNYNHTNSNQHYHYHYHFQRSISRSLLWDVRLQTIYIYLQPYSPWPYYCLWLVRSHLRHGMYYMYSRHAACNMLHLCHSTRLSLAVSDWYQSIHMYVRPRRTLHHSIHHFHSLLSA